MTKSDATIALKRFGLGARPGEMKRVAADPRGFILAALDKPGGAVLSDPDLDASHVILTNLQITLAQQKLAREIKRETPLEMAQQSVATAARGKLNEAKAGTAASADPPPGDMATMARSGRIRGDAYLDDATARFERAVTADEALLERLVLFWSNHFCVSAAKAPNVRAIAGAFEREAIRPHVLGSFAEMLKAVEQHPAMLIYLDNQISFGPNSPAGRSQRKGLNENLAREILELHTLGVDGGYTQADVTNLARIITGWTLGVINRPATESGKFFYAAMRHEPGEWTVAGKLYPDLGLQTGQMVLSDLARHPSTARNLARKLAVHFVSDDPPPGLVASLGKTFRDTDGDLAAVTRTLVTAEEAWNAPARKVVPPYDFLVAILRGFAPTPRPKPGELLRLASMLGQPLWQPPSPKGWPDGDESWASPSALRERLRIAEMLARQVDRLADPRAVAEDILGDGMSQSTRQAIAHAETREQGFELLIMSPEFQRR